MIFVTYKCCLSNRNSPFFAPDPGNVLSFIQDIPAGDSEPCRLEGEGTGHEALWSLPALFLSCVQRGNCQIWEEEKNK